MNATDIILLSILTITLVVLLGLLFIANAEMYKLGIEEGKKRMLNEINRLLNDPKSDLRKTVDRIYTDGFKKGAEIGENIGLQKAIDALQQSQELFNDKKQQ